MRHYSELELLDEVYLPGEPQMGAHLAACASCKGRLERLRNELGSIRGEFDRRIERKPDVFWERQRAAIVAKARRPPERGGLRPFRSWALAATLVIAVGGGWIVRERWEDRPREPQTAATATTGSAAIVQQSEALQLPTADPWAAEELAGWEQAVDWESWLEPGDLEQGGA